MTNGLRGAVPDQALEARLREALAVPLVLTMEAVPSDRGWICRAEYPELPGVIGEGLWPERALAELEVSRRRYLLQRLSVDEWRGVERPPLPYLMVEGLDQGEV